MSSQEIADNLRLSPRDLEQVLAELNRGRLAAHDTHRRGSRRWPCVFQRAVLTTFDRQLDRRHYSVMPRNISLNGMALVHGGYIHVGTACSVTLRTSEGEIRTLTGKVSRCQHLRAHLHDIGVHFRATVVPTEFNVSLGDEYLFHAEAVDPRQLSGRVTIVAKSRAEQQLVAHLYRETDLTIECATTGTEGLQILQSDPDFAVVDDQLPDMQGLAFLAEAHKAGIDVPIVLMGVPGDRARRFEAIKAGAKELLQKPLSRDVMLRAAAEFLLLRQAMDELAAAPGEKTMSQQLSRETIQAHLNELIDVAQQLQRDLAAMDRPSIRGTCEHLSATSPCFGFTAVAEQARTIIHSIDKQQPAEKQRSDVERLIVLINRARNGGPAALVA